MYGRMRRIRGETVTLAATIGFNQVRGIPPGCNHLQIHCPSATLENIEVGFGPKIKRIWFYDDSATDKFADLTQNLIDRNTSTGSGNSLNSMQTADFLYIGCARRFRGVSLDVTNTNGNAATATWEYWNGSAWTDITATDGTASGGATLAQDGLVTWTVPTDWVSNAVNGQTLYWARLKVSAALDATVSIVEVTALMNTVLNSANTDAEGYDTAKIRSNNDTLPPFCFPFDMEEFGGVELKSASITSAANLNWFYEP